MKAAIFVSFCFFLFSCKEKEIFLSPKLVDINEVIETVVFKDSLPVLVNDTNNSRISLRLNKIEVKIMPAIKEGELDIPEEPGSYAYVQQLLYSNKQSEGIFSKADSTYLLYQNKVHESLNIDLAFSKKLRTISNEEAKADRYGSMHYYSLSIPIFSKDGNTAYVEGNYYFGAEGGGWAIVLKRKNGEWEIIKTFRRWIS